MAQVDAWVSVMGSAITGAAALGSAALAQRATQARDQNARLWERRSEVHVEAVRWLRSLLDVLPPDDDNGKSAASIVLTPDSLAPLQLRAALTAYASPSVHASVDRCMQRVQCIVVGGTPPYGALVSRIPLRWNVETTIEAIRDELQGSNRSELPRWERFTMWLSMLPASLALRKQSKLAVRERIKAHGPLKFVMHDDESDLVADDNERE